MAHPFYPKKQGLYDPAFEHDSCGVGFVAHLKGQKSHKIIRDGLQILENLTHRGATGSDPLTGDGAGILIQLPDAFLRSVQRLILNCQTRVIMLLAMFFCRIFCFLETR